MKCNILSFAIIFLLNSITLADYPWVAIIDREGGDGGHLTVQINTTVVYQYIVYSAPQFEGAGFIANLEPGDVFIEWDEDPGHGNAHLFSFSGTYNDETPDFLQVSGTSITNWTVHTVLSSGTLIKTDDCCNEHEAIQLSFSPLILTKADDVNDNGCIVPGNEITYTICYDYQNEPNMSDINDVSLIDYLPAALEYISSDPPGSYSPQSRTVYWPIGTIIPGDMNCITLTVKVKDCIQDCAVITNLCVIKTGDIAVKSSSEYTPLCVASNPSPTFGQTGTLYIGETPDINLEWCPGYLAASVNGHDVYFGTDFNEVNAATTSSPQYKGRHSITSYLVNELAVGETYYWRVDEVNDPSIWQGAVWSFTTSLLIDDFERYISTENLNNKWLTGAPVCAGDGAGSGQVSLVRGENNQYMLFNYDKTGGSGGHYFSETMISYGINGANWMESSLVGENSQALVISFEGASGNSTDPVYDRMYIAIEDTDGDVNITLHPDPNIQAIPSWHDWIIPFADLNAPDINLESVRSFSVGFGQRCIDDFYGGADGNVMFDNIRLRPPCLPEYGLDADITRDCVVNSYDLSAFAEDWLACGICGRKSDIYPDVADGLVDFRDFTMLASKWLEEAP